ncbi:MAG: hypothetical protein HYV93_03685 [Candidatus Rokubacteria bacterium]|nr:hypothetical protein [Candidatus Rokubacteria bacterium]
MVSVTALFIKLERGRSSVGARATCRFSRPDPGRGRGLRGLLGHLPIVEEDPDTAALIRRLRHVRSASGFSRAEFLAMCRWKSPRALPQCRRNRAATIRAVSRDVLATRSERRRMQLLVGLRGVSVAMASAILTLLDPIRYGVLDIRVWQLLFALRSVGVNPRGRGFTVEQWLLYLRELRRHARERRVTPRALEWTLFHHHRAIQTGRLYC